MINVSEIKKLLKCLIPKTNKILIKALTISTLLAVFGAILVFLCFRNGDQLYSDIVVGNIIWTDHYKTVDYSSIYTYFLTLFISFPVMIFVLNQRHTKIIKKEPKNINNDSKQLKAFFLGALAYILCIWIIMGKMPKIEIATFIVTILLVLLMDIRVKNGEKMNIQENIVLILLMNGFSYFTLLAVLTFLSILFPQLLLLNHKAIAYIKTFVISGLLIVNIYFAFFYKRFDKNIIYKMIYYSQVLLPLLTSIVLKNTYRHKEQFVRLEIPLLTYLFIAVFCIFSILYVVLKIKKDSNNNIDSRKIIFFPSILSLVVFINYRIPAYSPFTRDDFHLGEVVLPWQQLIELGSKMYTEFISVQGVMGIILGGINKIIFSNTYSSFLHANVFMDIVFISISAFLICKLLGNIKGLVIILLGLYMFDRYYVAIIMLLYLTDSDLIRIPHKWIQRWIIMSIFSIFYIPAIGAVMSIAFFPFAVVLFYETYKDKKFKEMISTKYLFSVGLVGLMVLILIYYIWPTLTGLLAFIMDNGSANTVGYGKGLLQYAGGLNWFPRTNNIIINQLTWNVIRVGGWVLGISVALYFLGVEVLNVFNQHNLNAQKKLSSPVVCITTASILFFIGLISYTMGRIDPGLTRTGVASILMLGTIIPIIVLLKYDFFNNKISLTIILGISFGVSTAFNYQDYNNLYLKAISVINVPQNAIYVNGEDYDIPKLGKVFMPQEKFDEIINLNRFMNQYLSIDETYYDLTNRSALYYILDKKVPVPYSADYLALNYEIQSKVIKALEKNHPPIVWLAPNIRHDGGPASLRAYRIYKWLLDNEYRYYQEKNLKFLIRNDRYDQIIKDRKSSKQKFSLDSVDKWSEKFLNGETQFISNDTFKVIKKEKGWVHYFTTIDTLDEEDEFVYSVDMDITNFEGSQKAYVYVEFLDANDKVIDNYTSKMVSNSEKLTDSITSPIGTSTINFGLVIHQDTLGEITFRNIRFIQQKDIYEEDELFNIYTEEGLRSVFYQKDLKAIPVAWGRNFNNMAYRFIEGVATLKKKKLNNIESLENDVYIVTENKDPYIVWELNTPIKGNEFDFLKIKINGHFAPAKHVRGQVFWATRQNKFDENNSFVFDVTNGDLLIPLGSHPNWLMSKGITHLRLDIDGISNREVFTIESIKMHKLMK